MNALVIVFGSLVITIGVCVVIWTIFDTRRKSYQEYLRNKKGSQ